MTQTLNDFYRLTLRNSLRYGLFFAVSLYVLFSSAILQANETQIANSTYYVSTTGADGNPGTEAEPFATINKAVDVVAPGDTILVRGGTYREVLHINKSGAEGSPIRIAAYPGEQPILDGEYTLPGGEAWDCADVAPFHCYVFTPMIKLAGKYLELDGFTVIRSRGRGIDISAPSVNRRSEVQHVKLSNCTIRGARELGIGIIYSEHVVVENCDVSDTANYATHDRHYSTDNWPGIVTVVGANEVTVRGNRVYENWGEGLIADRGSTNIVIEDNIVYDNYALQIYVHRSQNVVVQRNLTYHTNNPLFWRGSEPSPCIVLENENDFSGMISTKNIKILNNVATGCNSLISIWGNDGGGEVTEDVEIAHNTMVNGFRNGDINSAKTLFVRPGPPYKNISIHNNIMLQDNGGTITEVSDSDEVDMFNNLWGQEPPASAAGVGDFVGDPQLANPYTALVAGQVTVDWYKPQDTSPAISLNMGPYEYTNQDSATPSPPTATPEPPTATPEPPASEPTTEPPTSEPTTEPPTSEPTLEPGTPPTTDVPPTSTPNSGSSRPEVLYRFDESSGNVVYDQATGEQPLNLVISDPNSVTWVDGGLRIDSPVTIRSETNAAQLVDSCSSSNELSIETWLEPENLTQDGPARIVSMSGDTVSRNFTLGQGLWSNQPSDTYNMRVRTSQTDLNGEPSLATDSAIARTRQSHIVFVFNQGISRLYVDGQEVASLDIGGNLDNWNRSYELLIANEASGDRPWLGTLYHVAIYCSTLTSADIEENFSRGADLPSSSTDSPTPEEDAPAEPSPEPGGPADPSPEDPGTPTTNPAPEVPDFLVDIFMPYIIH